MKWNTQKKCAFFFKNQAQEDLLKQFMVEHGIEWETEILVVEDAVTDYDVLDPSIFEVTPDDIRNIEKGLREAGEGSRVSLEEIESEVDERLRVIDAELNASEN